MNSDISKWVGTQSSRWISILIITVLLEALIITALVLGSRDNKIVIERSPYSTYPEIKIMRFSGDRAFREVWALHSAKTLGNIIPKESKLVIESLKYMASGDVYTKMLSDIQKRFKEMKSGGIKISFNPAGKILHDIKNQTVTVQGYQSLESLLTGDLVEKPYAYVFRVEAYDYGPYITHYEHGFIDQVNN